MIDSDQRPHSNQCPLLKLSDLLPIYWLGHMSVQVSNLSADTGRYAKIIKLKGEPVL
jgi:hypothetical protein